MPRRRSDQARQRRAARRYVLETAYRDKRMAESICMVKAMDILSHLQQQFKGIGIASTDFESGEVLTDNRGRGSLQQRV